MNTPVLHQPKNGVPQRHEQRSQNGVKVSHFLHPRPGWRSQRPCRERNVLQAMLRSPEKTMKHTLTPCGQNGMGLLIPHLATDAEEPMEVESPQHASSPSTRPCGVQGMGILIPHPEVNDIQPMDVDSNQHASSPSRTCWGVNGTGLLIPHPEVDAVVPMDMS